MKKVLLTGASGFVGSYILKELLAQDVFVYAFSRKQRASEHKNLAWLVADISEEESLVRPEVFDRLQDIDVIIHAAALYDFHASHEELYRQNVLGTANMLHFARLLEKRPHFAHISTIAVAGDAEIAFNEETFDVGQSFADPYASTKFASEKLVRTAEDFPSRSIYRLGIVLGSTKTGEISKIDGPYYMQKVIRRMGELKASLSKLKFLPLPYNENTRLYIIPVDTAAYLISTLALRVMGRPGIATFHVTGGSRGVSVRRLLQRMLAHYEISANPVPIPKVLLRPTFFKWVKAPQNSAEYFYTKWTFSSKHLEKELPKFRYPSYAHYAEKVMDYADKEFFSQEKAS